MTNRKAFATGITGQDGSFPNELLVANLREAGIDPDQVLKAAAG
jgi:GDP-D-mannose dehydratase